MAEPYMTESLFDRSFAASMLVLLLLQLLFVPMVCKDFIHCADSDPLQVPHEWYQSGDLLIGGILSQMIYAPFLYSFKKHPKDVIFTSL